jgi:hypothetical protein
MARAIVEPQMGVTRMSVGSRSPDRTRVGPPHCSVVSSMEKPDAVVTGSGRTGVLVLFWFAVIVPFLYLLSFGPVLALVERSGNRVLRDRVAVLYEPVAWLHDHTALKTPLEKYYYLCGGGK